MSVLRVLGFVLLAVALATLTGCGADDATEASSTTAAGPDSGVTVSGDTESAPEISIPDDDPPSDLAVEVVVEGEGDQVESGDLLVVDYAGQLWDGGEEFDSSWSRGEPASFPIGVSGVIEGWDTGLVGQQVGSRVLLVIPPALAYGDQESEAIPANSTLVFVVDIRDTFTGDEAEPGTPVTDLPDGLPEVSGDPGSEPTISVDGVEAPSQSSTTLLVEGEGEPLGSATNVVVNYVAVSLDSGEVLDSTWSTSPVAFPVAGLPGLAEALDGAAAGTRTLSLISAEDNDGDSVAVVFDVLGGL